MYLPDVSTMLTRRSMITASTPLDTSHFTLDTSGVSGFFGGEEAISAMATVHIYRGRRWLGWYNTPGSYEIARKYGRISKSAVFKGIFPGKRTDPATLFEFDGLEGPKFRAVASGTVMERTGHLAAILMGHCASIKGIQIEEAQKEGMNKKRQVEVTIVKLNKVPPEKVFPPRIRAYFPFFAAIPITVSLAACVASGVYRDWFSFSLILWGILSNGISCLVIGLGSLCFTHHIPAAGSPPGDGILDSRKGFVILQGEEGGVNSITQGKFEFEFPNESFDEYIVGYCSVLLTIQFIAQLFLIPQGSLFGQAMFVASLLVSWIYNLCLSAVDKEKIQQDILLDHVLEKPSLTKYLASSRTSALVLVLYLLSPKDPRKILDTYLPNDTKVWKRWKETIVERFRGEKELRFTDADWSLPEFSDDEKKLLRSLYGYAQVAYDGFLKTSRHSKGSM